MRGVRNEVALRFERCFEAHKEIVERPSQFAELVIRAVETKALVQVVCRDFLGCCIHLAKRPQEPPGDEPREPEGDQHGEQSHDGGSHVEVVDGEEPSASD